MAARCAPKRAGSGKGVSCPAIAVHQAALGAISVPPGGIHGGLGRCLPLATARPLRAEGRPPAARLGRW